MADRSSAEAVAAFVRAVQLALSCITRSVVRPSSYAPSASPHVLAFRANPVRLAFQEPLFLSLRHFYRVVEPKDTPDRWEVRTAGYFYALEAIGGHEIIAFHWHPDGASHVASPHLHLGPGAAVGHRALAATHIPTGLLTLDVLVQYVLEFGVTPTRSDWRRTLARASEGLAVQ